jgi:hypothetical protein
MNIKTSQFVSGLLRYIPERLNFILRSDEKEIDFSIYVRGLGVRVKFDAQYTYDEIEAMVDPGLAGMNVTTNMINQVDNAQAFLSRQ